MVNLTKGAAMPQSSNGVTVQPLSLSTGFVKVGDKYINPQEITRIEPYEFAPYTTPGARVEYKNYKSKPLGSFNTIVPRSDKFEVNCDKLAQCAVKAMQTGEIIDVMA